MTEKNSASNDVVEAGNDQVPYNFQYDHGRMPFFMKVIWVGFLIMATWYTVTFLLTSVGKELGG
jgi:hypothetical protein